MLVILICEQLRQRDCDSGANLGSIVRLCLIKMSQKIVKQNKKLAGLGDSLVSKMLTVQAWGPEFNSQNLHKKPDHAHL